VKRATWGLLLLAACTHAPEVAPAPPPANVVQEEMRLLLGAVQEAVAGVAVGDVRGLPAAIHKVHGAKEATGAALASGAWRPAKGEVARFREVDEAFHDQLVVLVRAAKKNDVPATAEALGAVLRGCPACHDEFRQPAR
jgi:cytochrome c556